MAYVSKIAESSWTSNVVVQLKVGNLVDLVEVLAVAATPRPCLLDQQLQVEVSPLQQDLVVYKAEVSVVDLAVDEAADSEVVSVAAIEDLVEEEGESDTKAVVDLVEEAERLTAMVTQRHPLTLLQVQAATEAASVQVGTTAHLSTAA